MEAVLVYIKHHIKWVWKVIEFVNAKLVILFYRKDLNEIDDKLKDRSGIEPYLYRRLLPSDVESLHSLINTQSKEDLKYFNPHGFDLTSLKKQFKNDSLIMMGVFDKEHLVGYFFLRFFFTRKCFVGRIIDHSYRGKGIGRVMNQLMYKISWDMNFRCLSTISRHNQLVMRAHSNNTNLVIRKELRNDYLLVEFLQDMS